MVLSKWQIFNCEFPFPAIDYFRQHNANCGINWKKKHYIKVQNTNTTETAAVIWGKCKPNYHFAGLSWSKGDTFDWMWWHLWSFLHLKRDLFHRWVRPMLSMNTTNRIWFTVAHLGEAQQRRNSLYQKTSLWSSHGTWPTLYYCSIYWP